MTSRPRVLAVDDDPVNLDIIVEILGETCSLQTAVDGEAALAMMPCWRPDLVLLDIMMPGRSGYEVCRKIRADDRYRATSVILVSGKATVEERLEGYAAGADDYIVKPFVDDELEAKVRVFSRLGRTEEIDRLTRDILSLVSHETRTPLNGIIGLSEILAGDDTLAAEHRECLEGIRDSGLRLAEFIRRADLLSRLKRDRVIAPQPGSLAARVRAAVEPFATSGVVQLEIDGDGQIEADWPLVDEVLSGLFDNAIRHGGGPIDVSMRPVPGGWLVQVGDRGPGLAPDQLRRLFTPLAIGDIAHHDQGHGLSLAIGREVAEQHGGFLVASNRPGGGAVFTLGLQVGDGDCGRFAAAFTDACPV